MTNDNTQTILDQVKLALEQRLPLSIHGAGSHQFILPDYTEKQKIELSLHRGIIDYQPTELTVKARCGTPITEIHELLAEHNQQLATDFPIYSESATLGGAIAIGHTGSGRPYLGAIRDHILGASLVNGAADIVKFGGQVMKNVAGYDVSRLLAGSRGTLGPILDISLKVLPAPQQTTTIVFEMEQNRAIQTMNEIAGKSLPVTASAFIDNKLYIRLQGSSAGTRQAEKTLGGEALHNSKSFWQSIQQQTHDFFSTGKALWRVIVPATTAELELECNHNSMVDWCGGLRWIQSDDISQSDFIHITNVGGYIESYRSDEPTNPADLMTPLQRKMHSKIKYAFDPKNLFNPKLSIVI